jgi:hypothetical protein
MNVPYTTSTGVKIGCRYMENGRVSPIDDPDMLFLQEALLATPGYISTRRLHNIVMFISSFTFCCVVLFAYLSN